MTHMLKWTGWTQNDRLSSRSPTSTRNGSPLCHFSFSLHSQLSLFTNLTSKREFIPKNLLFTLCHTFQYSPCMIWFLHSLKPANRFSTYLPKQNRTSRDARFNTWTLGVVLFNSLVTAPSQTLAPPRALHSVWKKAKNKFFDGYYGYGQIKLAI